MCRGCHGEGLSGGKIQGDPNIPIVANITLHETGLKDWTETDFVRAMREGKRRDGTAISEFMPWKAYGQMREPAVSALGVSEDGAGGGEGKSLSERYDR